jgi:hypothetical protein
MDVAALVTVVNAGVHVSDSFSKEILTVICNIIFLITHTPIRKTRYV